ncbi:MAG: exodeoxyribonuclease V subunit gamma, partial [Oxalobacter sp.]|nr:exodeoxyribonuclease V subunit gamma [Oxalobacter sp.]
MPLFSHRMMNVTMSHRLDTLAARLAARLGASMASPFAAEEVIVPSAAMRRHLSLALADTSGICANVRFSYLAQWFWETIRKVLPVAAESPYAADVLSWRIFHILEDGDFVASHPRLANWLKRNDQAGRFELAATLASLFEAYLTYRPDWLYAWFEGKTLTLPRPAKKGGKVEEADAAWQAALWRRIEAQTGSDGVHPGVRFFEVLEAGREKAGFLPERLSVFCLPAIAPQYLQMLEKISEWVEVDLYVLNPCREFWFDVVPEKRLAVMKKTGQETYHETGNALLAAWGKQTQSHLSLLMDLGHDWDFLPDTGNPAVSLLGRLQEAVLALEEPALEAIAPDDRSVEVHVCHSLMREVEVLHDQLLALFASDDPPAPGDILVVTPDVDTAAPLVDAVFGNAPSGARIPYRIMGRAASRINPVARAVMDIFALAASRFTAADVYDLLLQPLVAKRFGLQGAADQVYGWLEEAGICWGLDGEQKRSLSLPMDDSRSFHDGFYRLFLAYALPADARMPFGTRLPAGNPEGTEAAQLGSLWHFIRCLSRLSASLEKPEDGEGWREVFLAVLDDFICQDTAQLEDDLAVRQAAGRLFDSMGMNGRGLAVDADVMRRALGQALDESARGAVPSGAVTITAMAGLRNLPYRIVCAIGMNDGAFPGDASPLEFDLMARAPRAGDMQRRDDDRNIFLDLLLAARERFYISYTGKSVRDNTPVPPSVVVSELLDTIARALAKGHPGLPVPEAEKLVRESLVIEHPLQVFSRRYFEPDGDARIRSHHVDFCRALVKKAEAMAALSPPADTALMDDTDGDGDGKDTAWHRGAPFFSAPLPEPDAAWREVSLTGLSQFFANPSRFLLQNRMGVSFPVNAGELPANEPFVASRLDAWQLADRLLPLLLQGRSMDEVLAAAQAGTEFPSGM